MIKQIECLFLISLISYTVSFPMSEPESYGLLIQLNKSSMTTKDSYAIIESNLKTIVTDLEIKRDNQKKTLENTNKNNQLLIDSIKRDIAGIDATIVNTDALIKSKGEEQVSLKSRVDDQKQIVDHLNEGKLRFNEEMLKLKDDINDHVFFYKMATGLKKKIVFFLNSFSSYTTLDQDLFSYKITNVQGDLKQLRDLFTKFHSEFKFDFQNKYEAAINSVNELMNLASERNFEHYENEINAIESLINYFDDLSLEQSHYDDIEAKNELYLQALQDAESEYDNLFRELNQLYSDSTDLLNARNMYVQARKAQVKILSIYERNLKNDKKNNESKLKQLLKLK